MKDIYENRAAMLDNIITDLCEQYERTTDGDKKGAILHDVNTLSSIENNTAKVLVAIEANELKSREIDLAEVNSNEKHEVDLKEIELKESEIGQRQLDFDLRRSDLDIREKELELRKAGNELQWQEIDVKMAEVAYSHEKDVADKEIAEKKLEVEKNAVLGRIAGEGLSVLGTIAGVAGTILSLKAVMRFEKVDEGGIIPSKLMNLIFKNL